MGKKIKYIKLDADDIMEIVLHYYQEKFDHSEHARGILLGTPEKDLRFIGVFGDLNNKNIENIDLEEVDQNMDYNGDHAWLKRNPDFYIK
ncbi:MULTISPECIES: hypothetical protein [Clostridiaceae]|uniref:Uncharacterized protein n=1 Tax=Clostridium facile TaxID=2763035 RepID=A0ABR7INK3_9CLOT|nr:MULTISPECIES: hypothetical protein [Clostridiaceae]MBC5786709.1 hypothetical protein [Clostridium facile]